MSDKKRDAVEQALDAATDAAKSVMDSAVDAFGSLIGANSSSKDDGVTVTENKDGSTTVHIPKK